MPQHLGSPDRIIRIIAGVVLLPLPTIVALGTWGSWASYLVGAIFLATAVFNFCPIYAALGISTQRRKSA